MTQDDLWKLLRCPACKDALTREQFSDDEGLLRSTCGLWFPIVDGIPRIFIGELRATIYPRDFADFLSRHHLFVDGASEALSDHAQKQLATRESFGYEWTHFHEMLPEWERAADYYFEPVGGPNALAGKLLLDGGCGKGRQAYYALRGGASLIGVDFSRAVDVAKNNCKDAGGTSLFVQADLLALPFSDETFDLVYSFGVLHHLPDPEVGYRKLVSLVKKRGRMLVYLYHALEGEPVKQAILRGVNLARRVTSRMPHDLLLPLTNALGYGLYASVVLPYKVLTRIPLTHAFAESLPLKFYANYPVRVIVNDQFDRFSAPLENRYTRDEVLGWIDRAGLVEPVILPTAGWRAVGTRV